MPNRRHPAVQGSLSFLLFAFVLLLTAVPSVVQAQMSPGRIAATASVAQGPDVGMAYAASERMRLRLGVGFSSARPEVGVSRSSFSVQTGAWLLQPAFEGVSMFYGGSIEFLAQSGSVSTGDFGLVLQAGAEYAASRSFSIGGVVGLGYYSGDTSALGASGSRLGTSDAAVILTWWVL